MTAAFNPDAATTSFSGSLLRHRIANGGGLRVVEVSPARLAGRRRGRSTLLFEFDRSESLSIHFHRVRGPFTFRTEVTFLNRDGGQRTSFIFLPLRTKTFRRCLSDSGWTTLPIGH